MVAEGDPMSGSVMEVSDGSTIGLDNRFTLLSDGSVIPSVLSGIEVNSVGRLRLEEGRRSLMLGKLREMLSKSVCEGSPGTLKLGSRSVLSSEDSEGMEIRVREDPVGSSSELVGCVILGTEVVSPRMLVSIEMESDVASAGTVSKETEGVVIARGSAVFCVRVPTRSDSVLIVGTVKDASEPTPVYEGRSGMVLMLVITLPSGASLTARFAIMMAVSVTGSSFPVGGRPKPCMKLHAPSVSLKAMHFAMFEQSSAQSVYVFPGPVAISELPGKL